MKIWHIDEVQKEVNELYDREDRKINTERAIIKCLYKTEQEECLIISIILLEKKPRIMMRKIILVYILMH